MVMPQCGYGVAGQFGVFLGHDNAVVDLVFFASGRKFDLEHGRIISKIFG